MKRGIRQWKFYARQVLSGSFGKPVLGIVISFVLNLVCSQITAILFPGYTTLAIILSQVFAFVLSLLLWVISAGYSYMLMNLSRGKGYSLKDMMYFLKNQPDRVLSAAFVLALINVVCSIPANYYGLTAEMGTTLEEMTLWMSRYLMLTVLSFVLSMLLSLPFAMTPYLLADDMELGGFEALKVSFRMMKGHIGKYLLLQLSFLPWMLLSMFTMYIAMLWVLPYMEMSCVMFYRDLRGEFDGAKEGTQLADGSIQKPELPDNFSKPTDDFNSEA